MSIVIENPVGTRAAQKRATRTRIIACARSLFRDHGYEATSTRNIAERAGVAVGTVFAHFPEKEMLLRDILSSEIENLLAEIRLSIPIAAGSCEALFAYAERLISNYVKTPELSRTMLRSVMFDRSAYESQLQFFMEEIAERLAREAPALPISTTRVAGEALVANYLFAVVEALGSESLPIDVILTRLKERCLLVVTGLGIGR